ncbi:MAG TPA: carbohydrate-binding domain-containing protein [Chloroflexus aurantiacus]|uniref:Carbohydrate-binding domain-containing protein n=1 Tax=Chloroflexus aurantiacus (strain ATCC 29366 / DSM 635 / J-10-fl) TaxID=324602 RepID=A9WEQ6_CHLAA|nr:MULTISPECIES: carbohydrate-binding domain-containing protein [Chloroflexus]ABY33815.1 conserved hypothetical protein [Chloroflexus aurantiacus J-10-fl]RMG46641.1 MAG: carbohydrate-binding domain-containing protein [Chloroflexota bacterium]GIV95119.1 MAG: hypothetical protein KatS3mg056_3828 [Chloroflexus sp.]HBW69351.1 carbohydrate-binding domain-containing protein [Chloroflexus aurantiacus]
MQRLLAGCFIGVLGFITACSAPLVSSTSSTTTTQITAESVAEQPATTTNIPQLTPAAAVVVTSAAEAIPIELHGDQISAGTGVEVNGTVATITSGGAYRISGQLQAGSIVVNAAATDDVTLYLDGVTIHSVESAPLYIDRAGQVTIVLVDGSINTLSDEARTADQSSAPNATLYSDADLVITGQGQLIVAAHFNDGIASTKGLVIEDGHIQVTAVDDGLRGKEYLLLRGGQIDMTAGGDGFTADADGQGVIMIEGGQVTITANGDGVQAAADIVVQGGMLDIIAGGGSTATLSADASAKGLKAAGQIIINDGEIRLDVAEDGLHADTSITINGGTFTIAAADDAIHAEQQVTITAGEMNVTDSYEGIEGQHIRIDGGTITIIASDDALNAADGSGAQGGGFGGMGGGQWTLTMTGGSLTVDAGGDGIDVNGSITMSGGVMVVYGPTESMNAALDYDRAFTISAGQLIAVGSAGMAMAPDTSSTQPAVLINLSTVQTAGTSIAIVNAAGEPIVSLTPDKSYQSLVYSGTGLTVGEQYQVVVGGAVNTSFVQNDIITRVGTTTGPGGPGNPMRPPRP